MLMSARSSDARLSETFGAELELKGKPAERRGRKATGLRA